MITVFSSFFSFFCMIPFNRLIFFNFFLLLSITELFNYFYWFYLFYFILFYFILFYFILYLLGWPTIFFEFLKIVFYQIFIVFSLEYILFYFD